MNHDHFSIGLEFWCGGKRWRRTDIGTRVVEHVFDENDEEGCSLTPERPQE